MYVSKGFVIVMGAITLFLLASFATEEAQCIARARRILMDMTRPIPANTDIECLAPPEAPDLGERPWPWPVDIAPEV